MNPSRRCAVQWLLHIFASIAAIFAPWWMHAAHGQTTPTPAVTYGLAVTWTNTGGHLDCYGTGCLPINIATCNDAASSTTAWSVDLTIVTNPAVTITPGALLYYWVDTTGGLCTRSNLDNVSKLTLGINALTSTTQMLFPDNFFESGEYSTADLLIAVKAKDGSDFCTTAIDNKRYDLCFAVDSTINGQIDSNDLRGWLTIPIDTKAPIAPDVITATGGDQRVTITTKISADTDGSTVSSFSVRYRAQPAEDSATVGQACSAWAAGTFNEVSGDAVSGAATIQLSDLTNGITYEICSVAVDAAGNPGPGSAVINAVTQDECDFAECYPEELHTGYCAAGSMPNVLWMLFGFGLWRWWAARRRTGSHSLFRMNRNTSRIICIFFAGIVLSAPALAAQEHNDVIPVRRERDMTLAGIPKWGVDLRFGAFKPIISNNDGTQELYENIFEQGHDKSLIKRHPLMKSIEGSWYFWRDYGLLGVYGRIGHWSVSGKSLRCSTAECTKESATSTQATTDNNLIIVPFQVGLVYKMDLFKRYWNIPLVPYVKGGFDYDLWWINSGGSVAKTKPDNRSAKGGMWGYHGSAGLAVNMDFLEPSAARHGRSSSNILDSYIYFDVQKSVVNDFGKHNRLNLSGMQYSIGIALDFI